MVVPRSGSAHLLGVQGLREADQPLAYPVTDNLVEGKRKRRSNVSSPATHTASSSSSTTPTRKVTESPRASTGALSGKRKLVTSEEERSPAKRGRKSATVKPGEGFPVPPPAGHGPVRGRLLEGWRWIGGTAASVLAPPFPLSQRSAQCGWIQPRSEPLVDFSVGARRERRNTEL